MKRDFLHGQRRTGVSAFTLIELLTVITIIAILMALLFPIINSVRDNARKTGARQAAMSIVNAVKSYNTEYGKYPNINPTADPAAATTDDGVGDVETAGYTNHNNFVFNTLRAMDKAPNDSHELNPRRVSFFDGKSVSNPANPKDGFLDAGGNSSLQGCYFDPWGKEYCIVIDSNGDNVLDVGTQYTDFASDNRPRGGVGVFSMGKDKTLGTKGDHAYKAANEPSDDILSWVQ